VKRGRTLVLLAMIAGMIAPAAHAQAQASRVPKPAIVIEKGDKCVEDVAVMRREHMNLLKHQRGETVHRGVRDPRYSLNGCIECHASSKNPGVKGSVIGSDQNFCQSCHSYAAVKLDCFECHASRPKPTALASSVSSAAPPTAGGGSPR
jgi:hypothetical protein